MSYRVILAAASVLLAASPAAAEPVADFYQGKQIRFVIRAAPGGNYDLYMRLLARYMVRYLPGAPEANSPEIGGVECERSVSASEQLDYGGRFGAFASGREFPFPGNGDSHRQRAVRLLRLVGVKAQQLVLPRPLGRRDLRN